MRFKADAHSKIQVSVQEGMLYIDLCDGHPIRTAYPPKCADLTAGIQVDTSRGLEVTIPRKKECTLPGYWETPPARMPSIKPPRQKEPDPYMLVNYAGYSSSFQS